MRAFITHQTFPEDLPWKRLEGEARLCFPCRVPSTQHRAGHRAGAHLGSGDWIGRGTVSQALCQTLGMGRTDAAQPLAGRAHGW